MVNTSKMHKTPTKSNASNTMRIKYKKLVIRPF